MKTSSSSRSSRVQRTKRPPLFRRRDRGEKAERRPLVNPWNLANILSAFRIVAMIPLLLLILHNTATSYFWAFWLFIVMAVSDTLDGRLARKYGWVSNLGIFLDLTADKIYTAGILIVLVAVNLLDPWAAIIILVREFVVTGLRALAASEGLVIPAGKWGKLKMLVTIFAIAWILARANIDLGGWFAQYDVANILHMLSKLSSPVLWLSVLLTILSGTEYTWGARSIFGHAPMQKKP